MKSKSFKHLGLVFFVFVAAFLNIRCFLFQKQTEINNQTGRIKLIVCSRGCYQYLISTSIHTDTTLFFPDSIPEEFKTDKLQIVFSAIALSDSTQIFEAGSNDISLPVFKAQNLKIISISPKN